MPLGGKRHERGPPPPPPPARLYKIRLPTKLVVPPKPRPGSNQLTCIRYDSNGQYYVDEFVERSQVHGIVHDDRRFMTRVSCPKFHFHVALAACHHYCSAPCRVHEEAVKDRGWYDNGKAAPPLGDKVTKTPKGKKAEKKTNE